MFDRVDLPLGGAADLLQTAAADLHQVQEPLAVHVLFGPLDVQRRRAKRLQRLPQVDDLEAQRRVAVRNHGYYIKGKTLSARNSDKQSSYLP